jgi:hypothetical protein
MTPQGLTRNSVSMHDRVSDVMDREGQNQKHSSKVRGKSTTQNVVQPVGNSVNKLKIADEKRPTMGYFD